MIWQIHRPRFSGVILSNGFGFLIFPGLTLSSVYIQFAWCWRHCASLMIHLLVLGTFAVKCQAAATSLSASALSPSSACSNYLAFAHTHVTWRLKRRLSHEWRHRILPTFSTAHHLVHGTSHWFELLAVPARYGWLLVVF